MKIKKIVLSLLLTIGLSTLEFTHAEDGEDQSVSIDTCISTLTTINTGLDESEDDISAEQFMAGLEAGIKGNAACENISDIEKLAEFKTTIAKFYSHISEVDDGDDDHQTALKIVTNILTMLTEKITSLNAGTNTETADAADVETEPEDESATDAEAAD